MINRAGLGIACALAAAALYGFVPNMVRAGFENGVPPVESTFFRTATVGIVFAIIAVLRGEALHLPRPALGSFAVQCVATLVISVGYLASVQFIPVGLAVIIFFSFPVLIMLAAPLIEGHSPGLARIGIAVFAFAGLGVAVGPSFNDLDIRGILLAAAAAVACVLQFFSGRSISTYMTPTVFGSLVHLTILPAAFLVALYAGDGVIRIFPGGTATGFGTCLHGGRWRHLCCGLYGSHAVAAFRAGLDGGALLQPRAGDDHAGCRSAARGAAQPEPVSGRRHGADRPDRLQPDRTPQGHTTMSNAPIPVAILTGFLGAGKTTLLNQLLKDPFLANAAVIINEFGDTGIDHLLVERADENVIEMASGCLCCTIRGDLIDTIHDLLARRSRGEIKAFDRIVIETTGLADPAPVLHAVMSEPGLLAACRLEGVITVVDAFNGMATLDAHPEAVKQVAVADRIVLTKVDLLSGREGEDMLFAIIARLRKLNPAARLLTTHRNEATAERLFTMGLFDPSKKTPDVRSWLAAEAYATGEKRKPPPRPRSSRS